MIAGTCFNISKQQQQGVAAVEFALIAPVLFALILGIIDFGRMMFTMNLLQESTRRSAEAATFLFPDARGIESAKQAGILKADGSSSALINGLTTSHIDLAYLDVDGSVIASPANCAAYDSIRFVRAQLAQGSGGYSFEFVTPVNLMGFPKTMAMPPFQVILPRESLGWTNSGTPCSS
ncbi:TadE family protein [Endozoicomonas sp. GU-1]|uniref:TadE/TadG family type IV pilus assembly protein n=1 Tax=Endozoicomonas sp. GU-1 TaxID=3009078 RepID=UPI0022B308DE|nr:TadE family protein [Endozoicomonas sp. GU-1]WBA79851.1 pilus assembly protein [Endozoicomonas sp. GU-1]WBA87426.1 pilus assembly protein [Endozoicomonas sp. GU-1]